MKNKTAIEREFPNLVVPRSQGVAKGLSFYPFSTRLAQQCHHDDHTESCTCCISTYLEQHDVSSKPWVTFEEVSASDRPLCLSLSLDNLRNSK